MLNIVTSPVIEKMTNGNKGCREFVLYIMLYHHCGQDKLVMQLVIH